MYLLIWRHYHIPFPLSTLTEHTVLGNKPRLTFSHILGTDAHHVHQALAGQNYHSQHASRIGGRTKICRGFLSLNPGQRRRSREKCPSIQASMVYPRPGPLRPPRFRAPRKLWFFLHDRGGLLFRCPVASACLQKEGEASAQHWG